MAKAKKTTTHKTQVTKRGDQTPEAKSSTAEATRAAQKMFDDADKAALLGLPEDITVEQRENQVRRAALGY